MRCIIFLTAFLVGFFGLLLLLSSCAVLDGLNQFRSGRHSMPAYPAYIADVPVVWTEDGHSWLIDRTGPHLIK